MALANYTDLQAYVLGMLDRADDDDAVANVPNWIALAEDELRLGLNRLRVRQGELVNQAFVINSEYTALPTDYAGFRSCVLQTSPIRELEWVSPQVSDRWKLLSDMVGQPQFITMQGNKFRVRPTPDISYTATLTYYALPSLSPANLTNWLMTAHPKIYVRATMAEAYDYYENEEKRQAMEADRERLLSASYAADSSEWQGSALQGFVRSAP